MYVESGLKGRFFVARDAQGRLVSAWRLPGARLLAQRRVPG